jgi:hypothetical protein
MKPAIANIRFTIPPAMLFHHVKQKTAKVIFTAAKASTIHGRYFPIFIKKLSKIMTPSSFDVLGIELEDEDGESFSDIQVYLYTTINNLSVNKYLLINLLNVPEPKTNLQNAVEKICELSVSTYSGLRVIKSLSDTIHN